MMSRFNSSLKILLPKKTNKFNVPIFDCHQHLWNINSWHSSWLNGIPKLNRNFEVPRYINEINHSMNVIGSILVETDPELSGFNEEALYMTEVCTEKNNPSFAFIGSCEIGSIYFSKHISQFLKNPFYRGCRQVLMNKPLNFLKQTICLSNIQLLGRKKLLFEVLMTPENLFTMVDVISSCKNTVFIIDHCGGIQGLKGDKEKIHSWYKTIETLSKFENVVFKLSGLRGIKKNLRCLRNTLIKNH